MKTGKGQMPQVRIIYRIKGREISYEISTPKEVSPQKLWEGFMYAKSQLRLLDRLIKERRKNIKLFGHI